MFVVAADVGGHQPLHPPAQVAAFDRSGDQMEVVGHQAIAEEANRHLAGGVTQGTEEGVVVAGFVEHVAAAVAAVEDVVAQAAGAGSRGAGHSKTLTGKVARRKEKMAGPREVLLRFNVNVPFSSLADQVADGPPRPQGVRQAQLVGGVGVDPLPDAAGLLVGEGPPRAEGPAGAAAGEVVEAVGLVGGPPAADGLVTDAQQVGEFDLGIAEFDAAEAAHAKDLKGVVGELAGVRQLDRHGDTSAGRLPSYLRKTIEQLSSRSNTGG